MQSEKHKPVRLSQINIGLFLFALLLLYMVAIFVLYLRSDKVRGYQVLEGSLSGDNIYEGIALRKERIVTSPLSGYVNYFAAEGSRVAVGNLVYTVDESGNLIDYLQAQGTGSISLTANDLSELRTQIVNYEAVFNAKEFHTVYDFKNSLSSTVLKLTNAGVLNNIETLNEIAGKESISFLSAEDTGIVVYSVDGFETMTSGGITPSSFDHEIYEKKQMVNNALVESGDAVYKLSTDDNWSIVIPVTQEKAEELTELQYVRVKFLKNQDVSWAETECFTDDNGNHFANLKLNNSMQTFCTDRFINIELMLTEESGLKIPVSAIVNRRFFLVPKDCVVSTSDGTGTVRIRSYAEDGTEDDTDMQVEIYNETQTDYYLDDLNLSPGDVLLSGESGETFTVSASETLTGVFNINKGYADFKRINILYENDEYAIVASNTRYGLNAYDYIVLDAESVRENDMIYN